jgi:hypothetical protein
MGIVVFTAILVALIPSVALSARDGNTVALSLAIGAMVLLLLLDGVALGLMAKSRQQ